MSSSKMATASACFSEMPELNATEHRNSAIRLYEDIPLYDYDASILTPVFFGRFPRRLEDIVRTDADYLSLDSQMHTNVNSTRDTTEVTDTFQEYDPAVVHPATLGYVLLDKKPVVEEEEDESKPLPDPQKSLHHSTPSCYIPPVLLTVKSASGTYQDGKEYMVTLMHGDGWRVQGSPQEYLEVYIFPILLPALEKLLVEAKNNKVFEKRRTKFNACDFLTNYLYSHNPNYQDRHGIELEEIPFVQEILAINPRPPIPLSLLLSDDEAATIIQSYYKGYRVRKEPEVKELREYQREMREAEVDINFRVEDFWRKHSLEHVE